jgi:condensin complex subunit 3
LAVCNADSKPSVSGSLLSLDDYWKNLDPERAFLARVFVDHCLAIKDENRLEAVLPTVSDLARTINQSWNTLSEAIQNFKDDKLVREFDEAELQEREDDLCAKQEIVAELLKMAINLDYGDESGRRLMFPLIRELPVSAPAVFRLKWSQGR